MRLFTEKKRRIEDGEPTKNPGDGLLLIPFRKPREVYGMKYDIEENVWVGSANKKEVIPEIYLTDHTAKQYIKRYRLKTVSRDIIIQLELTKDLIKNVLMKDLARHKGLKINTSFNLIIASYKDKEQTIIEHIYLDDFYISTKASVILSEEDINNFVVDERKIMETIDKCNLPGSIMSVFAFTENTVNIYKYKPLGGSSYIDLPKEYKNTRNGLINTQNNDQECFKWCHIAHMYPVIDHKYRVSKYTKHDKDVDYTGITFPVTLNQISKIEEQNEININIFQLDDDNEKTVLPLYISDNEYEDICDMLLIKKLHEDGTILSHYVLITDLSSLLYRQNKTGRKVYYCK